MSLESCPGDPGDLVVFERQIGYRHYAVNVGDGYIVHLAPLRNGPFEAMITDGLDVGSTSSCCVCLSSRVARIKKEKFIDYNNAYESTSVYAETRWRSHRPLPAETIVERALEKLGEEGFNLVWKNCETFARWCRYDKKRSDQGVAVAAAGVGGTVLGAAGTVAVIAGKGILVGGLIALGGLAVFVGSSAIIGAAAAVGISTGGAVVGIAVAGGLALAARRAASSCTETDDNN